MLWVCIVFQILSVLAGASSGQFPAYRRYPAWTQGDGALRSGASTFGGEWDPDRDAPVYFHLEQLYSKPRGRDCLKCMVPLLGSSENPDLCTCLPCSFKMLHGHANLPRVIANNLNRLKCGYPCDDEGPRSDTKKYLDFIEVLMRSDERDIPKPVAEEKIFKEEFKPLGSGRRINGKSPVEMSHCPHGICEDMVPPRFRQSHSQKANTALSEIVSRKDAAGKRSGTDMKYGPFVMNDKSRAGLGMYNRPYPKPSFHFPAMRMTSPFTGKEKEIRFRPQTGRGESRSGEKKSGDNRNPKEISGEVMKTSRAEKLQEGEEKPENRNIALAIIADPEITVVQPAGQGPKTDSEEYVNIVVKQPETLPGESMIKKAEEVPEDESEESVEITEFNTKKTPLIKKYYPTQEEESTTVEAYPTTTENTSSEEMEAFMDNTTDQSTGGRGEDGTEETWKSVENLYHSNNEEMPSDSNDGDIVIGYRRNDGSATAKPKGEAKAGKERIRPKIVIEISDAKNTSKPGMDGVVNMKVDIYSKGDLGNVYRFLSKLIPPKFRSEKVRDSIQFRFQPLLDTDSSDYA